MSGRLVTLFVTYHKLYNSHEILLKVKIDVYKAVVLRTLLYGTKSWVFCQKYIYLLDAFLIQWLCTISNMKHIDNIHISEILINCNISDIESIFMKILLRWSNHLSHMNDIRIPKQLIFGQFPDQICASKTN